MDTDLKPAEKPVHPMTMIPNVSLEELERVIYSRDHERAGHVLLAALRKLKAGAEFIGYVPDPRLKRVLYTRFCAAMVALLADPAFEISQDGFDFLASEHAITDLVFRASAFQTSDHLLPQVAKNPDVSDPAKLDLGNGAALAKFLMTYSLRSGYSLNFEETFKRSPQIMFSLWAGMISPLLTTAVQASERREALLGMHGLFEDVRVSDAILPTLSDAYMYTSYGLRRDKHKAKGMIHRVLARTLLERGVPAPSAANLQQRRIAAALGGKPKLLVCLEWFSSLHAMYRCYAPILRQLSAHFHLVGMSNSGTIDEQGKAEFHEWHEVPGEDLNLAALVERINAIAPDMIWYPALGMAMWCVAIASLRLAPVQVMTLGHPASSHSPAMDYVLCDEGAIGDPALFTEKIVEYPNGSARYIMRPDAEFPPHLEGEDVPDVVRIAVPAMLCKLNVPFLSALREISQKASKAFDGARQVEFHFFVNMIGVNLFQAAREIRDWLPNSKIYERTHFNQYLSHLRQCHLHLCTFPFGGTNSNIDSMMLGIPLVTLLGDEPHERFDAMMIRRARLPEALVAKTREAYVDEAVRLITHDAERNALRDHLLAFDLQGEFFGEPPEGQRTAFADAMMRVYVSHGNSADGS